MNNKIVLTLFAVIAIGGIKISTPLPAKADQVMTMFNENYVISIRQELEAKNMDYRNKIYRKSTAKKRRGNARLMKVYPVVLANAGSVFYQQQANHKQYGINYITDDRNASSRVHASVSTGVHKQYDDRF